MATVHSPTLDRSLDAPVVFLYLPTLPFVSVGLDEAAEDKMRRDLLYVSITRAMDHLDLLASSASKQRAIKDTLSGFSPLEAAPRSSPGRSRGFALSRPGGASRRRAFPWF